MKPLQTIEVHPGAEPRATIIVLHGLGADGTDFLSFADEMKLGRRRPGALGLPARAGAAGDHQRRPRACAPGTTSWVPTSCKREDEAGLAREHRRRCTR